jgi:hypothetical protein
VAIVCAVLVAAGSARADRRRVAIIDLTGTPTPLIKELHDQLVDHFELQPVGNPVFEAALLGEFEDEDKPHVDTARTAKQEAEDALAQLDHRNAATAANRGMNELANAMPGSEILGLYAELAFDLGQAQLGLRRPNDASQMFALAHRLDPSYRPDPTRYDRLIVDAYRAAATKTSQPSKLEVKGAGRVWIDGIEQGPANQTYSLSEGIHLVQLTGDDRETRGEQVSVPQRRSTEIQPAPATVELMIKRSRRALRSAFDPAARADAIRRLSQLLGVGDAVLIAKGDGDKLAIQTWRDKTGFSARVEHGNEPPIDLLQPLAPPRKREPPKLDFGIVTRPPVVIETPWYKRRWVQASAGTAALAAIVTAILYARRTRYLPSPDPDIQVSSQ